MKIAQWEDELDDTFFSFFFEKESLNVWRRDAYDICIQPM